MESVKSIFSNYSLSVCGNHDFRFTPRIASTRMSNTGSTCGVATLLEYQIRSVTRFATWRFQETPAERNIKQKINYCLIFERRDRVTKFWWSLGNNIKVKLLHRNGTSRFWKNDYLLIGINNFHFKETVLTSISGQYHKLGTSRSTELRSTTRDFRTNGLFHDIQRVQFNCKPSKCWQHLL